MAEWWGSEFHAVGHGGISRVVVERDGVVQEGQMGG